MMLAVSTHLSIMDVLSPLLQSLRAFFMPRSQAFRPRFLTLHSTRAKCYAQQPVPRPPLQPFPRTSTLTIFNDLFISG